MDVALLSAMIVGKGLEFSGNDSHRRPDNVLTISVGDHGGSFIAFPRWEPNVLFEI